METPPPRFRGFLSIGDGLTFVGLSVTIGVMVLQSKASSAAAELQHRQASTKIAVGILSARAPKDKEGNIQEFEPDQQGLRRWAIEILNDSAKIKIPPESVEVIATGRVGIDSFGSYYTAYKYGGYDSFDGHYNEAPEGRAVSPPTDAPSSER